MQQPTDHEAERTAHRLQLPRSTQPQDILAMIRNVRPEATLQDGMLDLGDGARMVQDSDPRRSGRWTVEVPRVREDPAPEGMGDSHDYAAAFPEGLPFGIERDVLDLCWALGRRLYGAVVTDSGVRLEPHPHHVRDLIVVSPHRVDATELAELLAMVEPDVEYVGELVAGAERYALTFPLTEDAIEVRVGERSRPTALRAQRWIDDSVDYEIVHVTADPEEDSLARPDEDVRARWGEAYARIGRLAAVLAENVGGYVVDREGFLVAPEDLA
ncbi:hypothetical protein [Brachybacterium hainanense]|uniref:Uncharacterized protein n=1 Tax=Brachybacterium hainanense TaxID=1541174 RepID=A0ABV6RAG8_9MICO